MEILFVATELAPMAKVGGLGDVVFALSKTLRLLGHKVTILLPRYPAIEASGIMLARRLTPMAIPADGEVRAESVTVFDGRLGSGVDLVLIDKPGLFDRPGVYGEDGEDYADNAARFGVLCRAAVELVRSRAAEGNAFDVVHVHDWPTALVPYLLKDLEASGKGVPTKSVLTIHNLTHQGRIRRAELPLFGLATSHFAVDKLEFYGEVSALKGGIMTADAVTTVSESYAADIQTPGHADRLDGVLRARTDGILGILNGVDYAVWNPATDSSIIARFDADDPSNKGRAKSAVLGELGLEIAGDRPLVVSLGRVVPQKGSDVLASALPKLLNLDISLAIAGSGTPSIERALKDGVAAANVPGSERASFLGQVSEQLAHRLIAGADLVLVPSRYEPCGLVQMHAQRYGSVPIASRTGGLIDSIVDADASLETGTGFLFDGPTAENLVGAVQRGVAAMREPRWPSLLRRVMRLDRGWDRPARRYVQLYKSLVKGSSAARTAPLADQNAP
jgi:starch synthase